MAEHFLYSKSPETGRYKKKHQLEKLVDYNGFTVFVHPNDADGCRDKMRDMLFDLERLKESEKRLATLSLEVDEMRKKRLEEVRKVPIQKVNRDLLCRIPGKKGQWFDVTKQNIEEFGGHRSLPLIRKLRHEMLELGSQRPSDIKGWLLDRVQRLRG